jgi:hypothetical protein
MITEEFYNHCNYLATLNRMSKSHALDMENVIREKIDPKYKVCTKCSAQMKHGQQMLLNWLADQEIFEEVIPTIAPLNDEPLFEMAEPEVDVDVVEAEKVGCVKCSRKKKNKI